MYKIEKDKVLNMWVVWEKHLNINVQTFTSKYKKDCLNYIKGVEKDAKNIENKSKKFKRS